MTVQSTVGTAQSTGVTASPTDKVARSHGLFNAVGSEWIKLATVRSTYASLIVGLFAIVGISALISEAYVARYDSLSFVRRATFDPAFLSVSGIFLSQLAIGVLGVLTMSAEFGTGMMKTTLSAIPRRGLMYGAKIVVFASVAFVVGLIGSFSAFALGQAILAGRSLGVSLFSTSSLRVVFGAALYLALIGLFGLGLGAIIRRTAGAIAGLFGLLLIVPIVVSALPSPWDVDVGKYLPSTAGSALLQTQLREGLLAPWTGFAVFGAYAIVSLAVGLFLTKRRDA